MMKKELQIILIIINILMIYMIIHTVKKNKFDIRYAFPWLMIAGIIFILTIFPSLLGVLANLLGIYSEMNMLFFCGISFLLIVVYFQSIAISKLTRQVRKLTQEIAIKEKMRNSDNA